MKILSICSNEYSSPPPLNAIQASLSIYTLLNEALVRRGHEVTTVCGQGSTLETAQVHPSTKPLFDIVSKEEFLKLEDRGVMRQLPVPFEIDLNLSLLDALKARAYDVVHFHTSPVFLSQPFAKRTNLPNVFTLHGVTTELERRLNKTFDSENNHYVSISDYQRGNYPGLTFVKTILHGLDPGRYPFEPVGNENLVSVGRIKRIKGTVEAVQVANAENKKLTLAGDIRSSDAGYFYDEIQPLINQSMGNVTYLGMVDYDKVVKVYSDAKAFIFPLQWEEPFGLVLIESMATGTPVIAFARGSIPEVVEDGVTGFIVNPSDSDIRGDWIIKKTGVEGMREAVRKVYAMPEKDYRSMRSKTRQHFEKHFTIERMAEDYESVYEEVVKSSV